MTLSDKERKAKYK